MLKYLPEYENNGFFDPYLLHQLMQPKSGHLKPHFVEQTKDISISFDRISPAIRSLLRDPEFHNAEEAIQAWEGMAQLLKWEHLHKETYQVEVLRESKSQKIAINQGNYQVALPEVVDGTKYQEVRLIIRPHRHADRVLDFEKNEFVDLGTTFDAYIDAILAANPKLYILEFHPEGIRLARLLHQRTVSFASYFERIMQHKAAKGRAERLLPCIFSPAFFTTNLDLSAEKVSQGDSFGRYPIEQLRHRFKEALEALGQAYFEITKPSKKATKKRKLKNERRSERDLSEQALADQIKTEGSRFIFRLLLLFSAESKNYLSVPGAKSKLDPLRSQGFTLLSPMTIRQIAARICQSRRSSWQSQGTLLWDAIWGLFSKCRFGEHIGDLHIPAFNGQLFEPDRLPKLSQIKVTDEMLAPIIDKISRVDLKRGVTEFCDYSDLRVNHLGEIYQWLLEFDAKVLEGEVVSVKAKRGDLDFWMTKESAKTLEIPKEAQEPAASTTESLLFKVNPKGTVRQKTGSHYTQAELADQISYEALSEVIREAKEKKDVERILETSVLEPALGSAGILSSAQRMLGEAVYSIQYKEGEGLSRRERSLALQASKRRVLERCLYGVDRMVDAVELARSSLWLEALSPELPLPFLDQRLRTGDALVGTWFFHRPPFEKDRKEDQPAWIFPKMDAIQKLWNDKTLNKNFEGAKEEFKKAFETWKKWDAPWHEVSDLTKILDKELRTYEKARGKYLVETSGSAEVEAQLDMAKNTMNERLTPSRIINGELIQLFRLRDKQFEQEIYKLTRYKKLRILGDLYCSLWFWPGDKASLFPKQAEYRQIVSKLLGVAREGLNKRERDQLRVVLELGATHCFFHWEIEFPELFLDGKKPDIVLSNPPWDKVKMSELNFMGQWHPFSGANKKWKEKKLWKILDKYDPTIHAQWNNVDLRDKEWSNFVKKSGHFGEMSGTLDLYRPFSYQLTNITGKRAAFLLPQSLWINDNSSALRQHFFENMNWKRLVGYWNKMKIFPSVAQVSSFGIATLTPKESQVETEVVFRLETTEEGRQVQQAEKKVVPFRKRQFFKLNKKELEKISPNLSMPELRRPEDYELLVSLSKTGLNLGPMIRDSAHVGLHTANGLRDRIVAYEQRKGWLPIWKGGHFHLWYPGFQKENVEVTDERWKTSYSVMADENRERGELPATSLFLDPNHAQRFAPWRFAWRILASTTNYRTLIVSGVPGGVAIGNTCYVGSAQSLNQLSIILATMGSIVLDSQVRTFGAHAVNLGVLEDRYICHSQDLSSEVIRLVTELHEPYMGAGKNFLSAHQRMLRGSKVNGLVAAAYYWSTNGAFGINELEYIIDNHFPAVFSQEAQDKIAIAQALDEERGNEALDENGDGPDRGVPDPLSREIIIRTFKEWTRKEKDPRKEGKK